MSLFSWVFITLLHVATGPCSRPSTHSISTRAAAAAPTSHQSASTPRGAGAAEGAQAAAEARPAVEARLERAWAQRRRRQARELELQGL